MNTDSKAAKFESTNISRRSLLTGGANFEYSGLVTQALLLGNVALRLRRRLLWDGPNPGRRQASFKITNVPEANKYLHCPYRQGWTL